MFDQLTYNPPFFLQNGVIMTTYTALWGKKYGKKTNLHPEPIYQKTIFTGAQGVPINGWVAKPENAHSTIIGTYGITGELANQWYLSLLGWKAYALGYAVVLFDWRGHGQTAELSPTLSSDGLYEGEDFVRIAAIAAAMGCPPKFWLTGYSLGGQLALWGIKAAADLASDIMGCAVICPCLDSLRSLPYLVKHPFGRYVESRIAAELKKQAIKIHQMHPNGIDPEAIARVNSIWGFNQELVIPRLGFASVEEYYIASNTLNILPKLAKPTLIIYAADDPLFHPGIIPDLTDVALKNPFIDLILTRHGGHVGYLSSKKCQHQFQDSDPWWAWNRILEWINDQNVRSSRDK
jgi:predicted alpha/beta-fold hydrolase